MKKRLKINGIIIFCAVIIVAFSPRFFFRSHPEANWEGWVEVLGFAFILLGQIIRVSARGYKAEHSVQGQALIEGGPYQIVRNPMYLGIFLIGLGVVLTVFKWWAMVIFILIFTIRYLLLIYKEEKKLLKIFPDTYKEYCRKVPRIFPSLSSIVELDISGYLPIKIIWFKKEIGSIITLLLFVLLVESWDDILGEGFRGYLKQSVWLLLTFILFMILVILLSRRTEKKHGDNAVTSKDNL
ncbi:MAG: isoprenylcysteine carboxylmethyltransferase family protein [Candidatus Omnitrophica bacterium]|jgi:protein-S-isoprenylcysteine O-methyltransferase Ste14|nr:isoprenylcysteine carboxylmethyltransferase family protein [Candidatus Omnitrophota bacterium]MDD5660939.1 isoprenylcysteine carboxylmethyltransferase family protein [Candidatus Omnitrophota bacterium]